MEKEIWKEIEGYPNYRVSNLGNVKSLNYSHTGKEQILKPIVTNRGYLRVCLYKDGKMKSFAVHQLVCKAFLPNPNNYQEVNHKTENPLINIVYINEDGTVNLEKSELEWCTHTHNINYGTRNERAGKKIAEALKGKEPWNKGKKGKLNTKKSKPVLQLDKQTNEVIAEFPSVHEVERKLGFNISHISQCCTGKRKSSGGFKWRYKNE